MGLLKIQLTHVKYWKTVDFYRDLYFIHCFSMFQMCQLTWCYRAYISCNALKRCFDHISWFLNDLSYFFRCSCRVVFIENVGTAENNRALHPGCEPAQFYPRGYCPAAEDRPRVPRKRCHADEYGHRLHPSHHIKVFILRSGEHSGSGQ